MKRFATMDNRLSRSFPMVYQPLIISPVTFRAISPRWPERLHPPRHFYINGVRTKLIGANSYPNPHGSVQRLIVVGPGGGTYQKLTTSSSTAELSRSGVYRSIPEDLPVQKTSRRAVSCEDVSKTTHPSWDSRLSESGVSLSDSRTDLISLDGVSQSSFGSSSAFHEITCDSELDRQDSDTVSISDSNCGQERAYDGFDSVESRYGTLRKADLYREKSRSEQTLCSGRSSPVGRRGELYHSTPIKGRNPLPPAFSSDTGLSHILQSPSQRTMPTNLAESSYISSSRVSPTHSRSLLSLPSNSSNIACPSFPPSSQTAQFQQTTRQRSTESMPGSVDKVHEAVTKSQQRFFSLLQDCGKLQSEQTAGESVQVWLTTGHTQRRSLRTAEPSLISQHPSFNHHQQQPHQPAPRLSLQSSSASAHPGETESVRVLEQGPIVRVTETDCNLDKEKTVRLQSKGSEENGQSGADTPAPAVAAADVGGEESFPPHYQTAPQTASPSSHECGGGGSELCGKNTALASPPVFAASPSVVAKDENISEEVNTHCGSKDADTAEGPWRVMTQGGVNNSNYSSVTEHAFQPLTTTFNTTVASTVDVSLPDTANSIPSLRTTREGLVSVAGIITDCETHTRCGKESENNSEYRPASCDDKEPYRTRQFSSHSSGNSGDVVKDEEGTGTSREREIEIEETGTEREERRLNVEEQNEEKGGFVQRVEQHKELTETAASSSPSGADSYSCDETTCPVTETVNCPSPRHSPSAPPPPNTCIFPSIQPDDQQVRLAPQGGNSQLSAVMSTAELRAGVSHHSRAATDSERPRQWSCPETSVVDGGDHLSSSPIREVSRRHTRHVHRSTVQETVTTHRHVCHGAGSPTALGEGCTASSDAAKGYCEQGIRGEDFVTDTTVSTTTVREEDSEREETVTQQRLASPDVTGERAREAEDHARVCADHSVTASAHCGSIASPADTHLLAPSQPVTVLAQGDRGKSNTTPMMTGRGSANTSFNLLDSLEQQLSLLSSEDVSFTSDTRSPRNSGQVAWYTDHAEASLPRVHKEAEDKSGLECGRSSVFFSLQRTDCQQQAAQVSGSAFSSFDGRQPSSATDLKEDYLSSPSHGSLATETRREFSLRHTRVSKVLSSAETLSSDEGDGRGGGQDGSSLGRGTKAIQWQRPVSSSELDDSDGNYSSISTSESSHRRDQSETDFPPSDCGPEDYDNVDTFNEFVSGLLGQYTSDQPSQHQRTDMVSTDIRSSRLRSFIQETILEADDESETADEADTTSTTVSSFKSSFHFSVPPPQSTPRWQSVSPVPQIKLWSTDQQVTNLSASEDMSEVTTSLHPLQELSDKLSSFSDVSFELHTPQDSRSHENFDLSESRQSACDSPTPSDFSEGSLYCSSATAEVRKQTELVISVKSAEPIQTQKMTRRNLEPVFNESKKNRLAQENSLLFQKLLNDFELQCKTSEQKLFEDMLSGSGRGGAEDESFVEKKSEVCHDLYRSFTRDFQEKRQSHVCPFIEDHLPVFRFKRFLKKKHNSKLKGRNIFRIRNQLDRVLESPLGLAESGVKSVSETDLPQIKWIPDDADFIRHSYRYKHSSKLLSPTKLRDRLVSEVFTDDSDVKKSSFSDSAYSTLSDATSRHVSDFDSTLKSVCSSRGDVSSIATDASIDGDKLTSLSDVFDQLDMCEGEIDQALLDRLRVGHYKADTL